MGLLQLMNQWRSRGMRRRRSEAKSAVVANGFRRCRIEALESRQLMAADLYAGSVYFEPANGTDSVGNTFTINWQGGATGTDMSTLTINLDKNQNGSIDDGEAFFNTVQGAPGVYGATPLTILSHSGFTVDSAVVSNGGQSLTFTFTGFQSGDTLQFQIDVDEQGVDAQGNQSVSAVVEGKEFEGSILSGTFTNPNYYTATGSGIYVDAFNSELQASGLNLPPDSYTGGYLNPTGTTDETVFTAGVMFPVNQIPLPSSIAGNVSYATNGAWNDPNATFVNISGVTLQLLDANGNAVLDSNGHAITTTTDANGNYEFDNLGPGTYRVREIQPAGYLEGGDKIGSLGGAIDNIDELGSITVVANDHGVHYDFVEQVPATVSGNVYVITNGDCDDPNATKTAIAGVSLTLVDSNGNAVLDGNGHAITTVTDANGHYSFTGLNPGTYGVRETVPAGYIVGCDYVGTVNGTPVGSKPDGTDLTNIQLFSGQNGINYNFHLLLPVNISGTVDSEVLGNCVDPTAVYTPLAGVTVVLVDANGNNVLDGNGHAITTVTDVNGHYSFTNLAIGTYGVHMIMPAGYYQDESDVGTVLGVTKGVSTTPIALDDVQMYSGQSGINYNFIVLPPPSIAGKVIFNQDGDCDPSQPGVANVTVNLLDSNGHIVMTTTTDANGEYIFKVVPPGTYTVQEIVPGGYLEDAAHPGCNGGVVINPHTITLVGLNPGEHPVNYDFCIDLPVDISGQVFVQSNANCVVATSLAPLAGVTVVLVDSAGNQVFDGNGNAITTVTAADGSYSFSGLRHGTYGVHILQPTGYYPGYSNVGTVNGLTDGISTSSIALDDAFLNQGQHGIHYDFVVLPPATLAGKVIFNTDGTCDPTTEPGVPNVTVNLLDANGNVVETTTTDANGLYSFTLIPPGTYTVQEVVPGGFFEQAAHLGCNGGVILNPHTITLVGLNPGDHPVNYDFCIMTLGTISGFAFQDGSNIQFVGGDTVTSLSQIPASLLASHDGKRTSDDTMLAGVVVTLADANGVPLHDSHGNLIQTTTDANGHYIFKNLLPGSYTVLEGGAGGYFQWINTPGSTGGNAPYLGNVINSVTLTAGQNSVENDFSFVRASNFSFFLPFSNVLPPPNPTYVLPQNPYLVNPLPQVLAPNPQNPIPQGSGADGYTWHLSVINAGQPRQLQSFGDAVAQFTAAGVDIEGWANGALKGSTWKLRTQGDDGDEIITSVTFGMMGGLPVTGDFDGDGRTDVGVFLRGQWFIDLNGNGYWDNEDLWAKLGYQDDLPATGDWDGDGKTDIGIFGRAWPGDPNHIHHEPGLPHPDNTRQGRHKNVPPRPDQATHGVRTMQRSSTGKMRADLIDHVFHYGVPGDMPIAGAFNGSGIDTIGVFRDGQWHLDIDGDGRFQRSDLMISMGQAGDIPVIGDFNGDGIDELGVYRQGTWLIDLNGDHQIDDANDMIVDFGGPADRPIVGDWDGDGRDDMGVYQEGVSDDGVAAAPQGDLK